ncbi:exosortase H [Candidatus Hydrogenedentota bacterium]
MEVDGTSDKTEPGEKDGAFDPRWMVARFVVLFLVIVGVFLVIYQQMRDGRAVEAFIRLTASSTALFLDVLPWSAVESHHDVYIAYRGFRVEVIPECGGIEAMSIYFAALIAFPSRWPKKLIGIVAGIPLIFATNILRLACLCVLGAWNVEAFEFVHLYVWQAIFIAFVVVLWLIWVDWIAGNEK